MRYKQFLLNEGRSKSITKEVAFETIKKKCKQAYKAYKNGKNLYRGLENNIEYLFVDPKQGSLRKSANTSNYYTLLIDNNPYWKKYPKRSQSIICTNNYSYASGYGIVYEVFPYDGAKMGVCPSRDFWFSFENTIGDGNSLNFFNFKISKLFNQYGVRLNDKDFPSFKKSLEELEEKLKKNKKSLSVLDFITNKWLMKSESFIDNLYKILNPSDNGFKLTSITNIPNEVYSQELWTDSKSIMIKSLYGGAGGLNTDLIEYMDKK